MRVGPNTGNLRGPKPILTWPTSTVTFRGSVGLRWRFILIRVEDCSMNLVLCGRLEKKWDQLVVQEVLSGGLASSKVARSLLAIDHLAYPMRACQAQEPN
jgi:hypothetical protein